MADDSNLLNRLDHLVFGGPDLAAAIEWFTERTGVVPIPGGRHVGRGTANYLVGLGPGSYLEIIGPDPDAPEPVSPRWFALDGLAAPGLLTWAVRPVDLEATVAAARIAGYDPGEPTPMSRAAPDGSQLSWRLTPDTVASTGGTVPFLIDWGASSHPSERVELPQLELLGLAGDGHRAALRALAIDLAPAPRLTARLRTPLGTVELS